MKDSFQTISVIGLGYIGLPTAAMFAMNGKKVIGVDINPHTVETINEGKININEPDLEKIVAETVLSGNLRATSLAEPADVFLIAVPTPFKDGIHSIPEPNLEYIMSAAHQIAPVLKKGDLIILESTSPVGTTEKLVEWLHKIRNDLVFPSENIKDSDINIAYCPERVLPGQVIKELVSNDRVIGGVSNKCSKMAAKLYKVFVKGRCFSTNARTAEMVKLTENSCRDVEIAFANELSIICDELDINVWELISLANNHPRINILQPGPGVGGHCIAVDPWFIVSKSPLQAKMIKSAREVNNAKPQWVVNKVQSIIFRCLEENPNKSLDSLVVACYGLSFKADIEDLRESPALNIARSISKMHKGRVIAVEPNISSLDEMLDNIELVSLEDAQKLADIHLLLVDHKQFREIDFKHPYLIDTKGIW
jgi:UDP-N-acetyl-D-mannosaminuronic acid dehydrogenase